ncbi:enoyl-CoA hydratase/isomerase family protein [Leucobacter sp. Z1108]|uniref:enoyl-CoA hydratase/isomerase family protein n=1 Tax=Leucobacter sp. Z1108 TaxID=3439066 RepID=UPI003F31A788
MNETDDLLVHRDGGELWLRLNRPQARNAINWNIRRALHRHLLEAEADPRIRAVVIAGTEVAFCSGGDIKEMGNGPEDSAAKLALASEIVQCIARMPKPVIAAVQGHVAGAGIGLALSCDLVFASSSTVFSPAFVQRGLGPDMSTSYWLTRALGIARAKQLLLTARQLDASQALELGLVTEVIDEVDFDSVVRARVTQFSMGPTIAISQIKSLVNAAAESSLPEQLDLEAKAQGLLAATEDHRAALQAFSEKRNPSFQGR